MSNAIIESPVAASQLFFAWSEQAEVGVAPAAASEKTATGAAKSPCDLSSAANLTRQLPAAVPTGHLTFTSDGRIARPVRIGSVMIKLLKRYGITDAEIAEGVASYARKHQQAWAS